MSNEKFWMIYFVLLLPCLKRQDYENLATPEVVVARNLYLQAVRENWNAVEESQLGTFQDVINSSDTRIENVSSRNEILAETANSAEQMENDDGHALIYLEEAENDTSSSMHSQKHYEWKEDVLFSDLSDNDNDSSSRLSSSIPTQNSRAYSPSGSSDWIHLNVGSEIPGTLQNSGLLISQESDTEGEEEWSNWLLVDASD